MPRAFLALDLPPGVKEAITAYQSKIESQSPGLYRWTPPENLHLTLYFLGDMEEDLLQEVKNRQLMFQPFEIGTGPILTLPERNVPKILALELVGETQPLRSLQQRIHDSVFQIAAHRETRPFVPHITIARLKKDVPPSAKPVKRLRESLTPPPALTWEVNVLWLYTSTLNPEGPTYEKNHRFPAGL